MNNTSQDTRERIGVRNSHNIISIIFLSLVALLALSFSVMLLIKNASLKREEEAVRSELEALNEEGYYTLTEADKLIENAKEETRVETTNSIKEKIQEKLEAGEGTTSTIRSLFPDQMVVASSGRYYFFPILDSIAHHGFTEEDFEVGEDGFLEYVGEDGSVNVKKGVDVSRFQGKIDWDKVADAGIDFAFRVEFYSNTYKNTGLPPGPIKIASVAGIDAVLNRTAHDYLYMCAKEDFSGTHNFARTYQEHLKNAAKYSKALNERGIK